MARVFVSHAGEDRELARRLHRWLIDEGHEVFLAPDLRDGITVGEQWAQRLHDELLRAEAMVCVITSAYLASHWCTAEVSIAQSRGSRLLPLQAEPGVAHPFLANVQCVDLTQDPDAVLPFLVAALSQLDTAWPADRSPFPGLRPFDVDQCQVFFGRADDVGRLAELLRSPAEHAKGAALVVGPSGCGKSSLVRAGLLPRLADEPGWSTLPPILPGAHPVAALARELATAARQCGLDWTVEHVHHQLEHRGLTGLADELLLAIPGGPRRRLLLVVDQFEELLTQTDPAERAQFAELLRLALAGPVHVVATMRPEFLDELLLDPELAVLPTHTYMLRPLRREALRDVIEKPARLAGIELDDGLVDRLVEDTDSGEALPLLAFTLAQLADGVTRGGRLSATRYDQLGGVQGALTSQADAALADAIVASGRSREQVIAGLLRLVTVDEQGRPTRWRVLRDELPTPVVTELDDFVGRRLLTTDTDSDAVVIGVAHEAFLSTWPPLAAAITANVSALRARRAVEHAATEWNENGRPPARLWSGGQLDATVTDTGARITAGSASPPGRPNLARWRRRVLATDRVDLSVKARDFLHASMRRDRYRRRRAITILSVLLILALVAAGVAIDRQRDAEQGQRVATARNLVDDAEAARGTDLHAALQLGLAAHRLDPGDETRSSLVNTLAAGPYAGTLTGHIGAVESAAFAPDGRTLATGSKDKTVILWDFTDPAQPQRLGPPLTGHANWVNSVAFAPDGRTLATSSLDHTVILWDLTDRTQPRRLGSPLTDHTDAVSSVTLSPDGRTLVTGSSDKTVILWDLTDRAQPRRLGSPLTGHTGSVNSVAWTPDGRTLLTGSADRTVMLWDLTDRVQPRQLGPPLTAHTDEIGSLALAPDGHTLAVASYSGGGATLWDVTDPAQPRQLGPTLEALDSPVSLVTFAPHKRLLATSNALGTTTLWDLTDPTRPHAQGPPLTGHNLPIRVLAFAPNGRTLVVGSTDGAVILWDLTDPVQPRRLGQPLTGHSGDASSVEFAPDGRTLVTGSYDTTAVLWDVTDPAQPYQLGTPLTGHTDAVYSVAFAPDGRTLATSSLDSTVILWDVTHPAQPRQLGPALTAVPSSQVASVAFAPDGRTLVTGRGDKTAVLWDVTDLAQPRQLGLPLTGHTDVVYSVTFAPDGRTLATGSSDATAILWDVTDPAQPRQLGQPLTGHNGSVFGLTFAPGRATLATGSDDGTVILWDLTEPAQPRRLDPPLTGTLAVSSVAFAPDGLTLAVGSLQTILWDLTDPVQPRRFGPPLTSTLDVSSVAFALDGRTLATSSQDGKIILWDLADLYQVRDHAVERACSITHGGLTRDEWARNIPDLPYQDSCPT
ncbi:MAG: nSTAND1 domain-containing NTPase [Pseudonocardiales bacterium]